jgi:hypothetical protein
VGLAGRTAPATDVEALGRLLMGLGAMLALVGALLYFGPAVPWLGQLPGDIRLERAGFRLYFPLTTCVLLSALLSALLYLWSRLR